MPATRLDRLVSLLDIGSSSLIRTTAATQLGQIAALRVRGASTAHEGASSSEPAVYRGTDGEWNEVLTLLARVVPLLLSKNWDTRMAAAQAIYHITQAAGVWDPDTGTERHVSAPIKAEETPSLGEADRLQFASFSLPHVLQTGTKLLASVGKEYDVPELMSRERLQHAKKDVLGKLGLGFGADDMDMGIDMDAELAGSKPAPKPAPAPEPEPGADRALSARERNQLKRKRKLEAKAQTRAPVARVEPEKRAKLDSTAQASDKAAAVFSLQTQRGEWPFRALAELLSVELVSPTWEARHGAALGLRELFRTQGYGGGRVMHASKQDNDERHAVWCENLSLIHI